MNIKPSKLMLPIIALGVLLIPTFQSVALASPGEHNDQKQVSAEKMHGHHHKHHGRHHHRHHGWHGHNHKHHGSHGKSHEQARD